MMPREIREAVSVINDVLKSRYPLSNIVTTDKEKISAIKTAISLIQLHLQAASELPERKNWEETIDRTMREFLPHYIFFTEGMRDIYMPSLVKTLAIDFNSCLDQATIVVAKKNEEVALLKKENEELKKLYDGLIQNHKNLVNVVEPLRQHITTLEDDLKMADGIPSIEDIDRLLDKHTVIANDDILYRKGIAQAIHALLTTRKDKER